MRCPYCGCPESKVIDSRAIEEGDSIRRRRECLECGRRFTTYEIIEKQPLMVIKKDGRRVFFDKTKLLNGLLRACEKRPIPLSTVEAIVDAVEREIRNTNQKEISSRQVGEMVLNHLRVVDQVAYVRFASVYRQFADINNFMEELQSLMKSHSTSETKGE